MFSLVLLRPLKKGGIPGHEFSLDRAKEAFETQCNIEESIKVLIKP